MKYGSNCLIHVVEIKPKYVYGTLYTVKPLLSNKTGLNHFKNRHKVQSASVVTIFTFKSLNKLNYCVEIVL